MIETRRLKNVVVFIQTVLSSMLSRKIINIDNDVPRKYGNVTVKIFFVSKLIASKNIAINYLY